MGMVEELYDAKYFDIMVERCKNKTISKCAKNLYESYQKKPIFCELNLSLTDFAACCANFSPNQKNIGENAQLELLQHRYKNIKKLPSQGEEVIGLYYDNEGKVIIKRGENTNPNVTGTKCFDAIRQSSDRNDFFMLKTIDIGSHSKNKGGGTQKNVKAEIEHTMFCFDKDLIFENKLSYLFVLVDGRSSNLIKKLNEKIKNYPYCYINSVENICFNFDKIKNEQ